jgi:hypothetical protein
MNHKIMKTVGILAAIMVATAVLTMGINWARASEPARPVQATAAQVDSSFTYQGSLDNGGTAVNGNCDLQFSLYDASSSGTQAGSTLTKSNVAVSDSLFTVNLDFGNQFNGDARYLQIGVRCPAGSGSYTSLNGRVALTAAPYALSLMPGASVQSNSSGFAFEAANTASGAGIRGETVNGNGVEGVVDWVNSGTGVGVYGAGGFYGSAGLFENENATIPTMKIQNIDGSSAPALVVTGTTRLEGDLTWKPVTSYLSIPPAAFQPTNDGLSFTLGGYSLSPGASTPATAFYAPVMLPHGATVTRFTFHWRDNSASDGNATLFQDNPVGLTTPMASVATSGSNGQSSSTTTTTISANVIDNSQYQYYVYLTLPDSLVELYSIFIEYTITQPH